MLWFLLLPYLLLPSDATTTFDVTKFGAVGDGTTDDTKAIASALVAASKSPPTIVFFPPSKVFLTGPINMTSSMTLQVDGTIRAISGNNTDGGEAYIRNGGWPQIPPLPSYGDSRGRAGQGGANSSLC